MPGVASERVKKRSWYKSANTVNVAPAMMAAVGRLMRLPALAIRGAVEFTQGEGKDSGEGE